MISSRTSAVALAALLLISTGAAPVSLVDRADAISTDGLDADAVLVGQERTTQTVDIDTTVGTGETDKLVLDVREMRQRGARLVNVSATVDESESNPYLGLVEQPTYDPAAGTVTIHPHNYKPGNNHNGHHVVLDVTLTWDTTGAAPTDAVEYRIREDDECHAGCDTWEDDVPIRFALVDSGVADGRVTTPVDGVYHQSRADVPHELAVNVTVPEGESVPVTVDLSESAAADVGIASLDAVLAGGDIEVQEATRDGTEISFVAADAAPGDGVPGSGQARVRLTLDASDADSGSISHVVTAGSTTETVTYRRRAPTTGEGVTAARVTGPADRTYDLAETAGTVAHRLQVDVATDGRTPVTVDLAETVAAGFTVRSIDAADASGGLRVSDATTDGDEIRFVTTAEPADGALARGTVTLVLGLEATDVRPTERIEHVVTAGGETVRAAYETFGRRGAVIDATDADNRLPRNATVTIRAERPNAVVGAYILQAGGQPYGLTEATADVRVAQVETGAGDVVTLNTSTLPLSPDHEYGVRVDEVRADTGADRTLLPPGVAASDLAVEAGSGSAPVSITASATVRNTWDERVRATVPLRVGGVAVAERTVTLAPGETRSVSFTYEGHRTGAFDVGVADLGPETVVVEGAAVTVGPDALSFGVVGVGERATEQLTIRNPGDAPLDVTALSVGDDSPFSVDAETPFTVDPGAERTVPVAFEPAESGRQSGTLVVETNAAADSTVEVPLANAGWELNTESTDDSVRLRVTDAQANGWLSTGVDVGTSAVTLDALNVTFAQSGDATLNATVADEARIDPPESAGYTLGYVRFASRPDGAISNATATVSVSPGRLADLGATATNVTVYRRSGDSWTAVPATSTGEADGYQFRARASGLSTLAVAVDQSADGPTTTASTAGATTAPGATTDTAAGTTPAAGTTAGTDDTLGGPAPGFGLLAALLALVLVGLVARRRG